VAPNAFTIHPCELNAPEEEAIIMDMTFMSHLSEALYRVPSFSAWLEKQNPLPMYSFLKKILQLLQWQSPGLGQKCRWLLKTPNHLEWLETLFQVFPQAQILQTYRDPVECLTSSFSASCHARRLFSDEVDPAEVANHWLAKNILLLEKGLKVRQDLEAAEMEKYVQMEKRREEAKERENDPDRETPTSESESEDQEDHSSSLSSLSCLVPSSSSNSENSPSSPSTSSSSSFISASFLDIHYKNLLKNTMEEMQKLYAFAKLEWNFEVENKIKKFLKGENNNLKVKYGKHEYDLKDFGITNKEKLNAEIFKQYEKLANRKLEVENFEKEKEKVEE